MKFQIGERVRFRDCPEYEGTIVPTHPPWNNMEGCYSVIWDNRRDIAIQHESILVSVDACRDFRDKIEDRLR